MLTKLWAIPINIQYPLVLTIHCIKHNIVHTWLYIFLLPLSHSFFTFLSKNITLSSFSYNNIYKMDGISSVDDSTNSEYSLPMALQSTKSPESLCRGTSGTLDAENGIEAESRKLPSSRFKGVVPQPNGRWGAQIYEKHQRVWLGTFNEEEEAAKSYDIAAKRFRGRDAVTNFKETITSESEEDDVESEFLNSHSKSEIVDMLRKHTYNDELEQSRRNYGGIRIRPAKDGGMFTLFNGGYTAAEPKAQEHLFEKAVTPSDVGKLNRLVIPKQHAEKHFPLQSGNTSKGMLLNLEDMGGKVWRFRYSYWNSSQSYVLTKGWSRFVKEKNLRAGDIVSFQRSTGPDKQLYIDWKAKNGSSFSVGDEIRGQIQPVQMVRLFGVNILYNDGGGAAAINSKDSCSGKRMREMELFGLQCTKKHRIIDAL